MKKFFSVISAILMLSLSLAACTVEGENSSDSVSDAESDAFSEEPSEVVYEPCPAVIKIYTQNEINKEEYVGCTVRVEDPSGKYETITDKKATIKIRGNSTASGRKKPYNIKFDSKQDVLGMGECKKWYLLANMYDKSLIRNKLVYDFAAEIGMAYTQQSTFARLYLNDMYMGSYQICESLGVGDTRVDINTAANDFLLEYEPRPHYSNPNYTYTPLCGILFGFDEPSAPTKEQLSYLREFLKSAEGALLSGNREQISRYWDIDSFVDDYIVHEYFKCVDAQTSSTRYYIKNGKIYGGPVWDFDLSSGNADRNYYTTYQDSNGDSSVGWWCDNGIWYKYFFRTQWFEQELRTRFAELQPMIENLTDDNELGKNRIDRLLDAYGESFEENFGIWSITDKDSDYERIPFRTYEANVEFLRKWLRDRNTWMKSEWSIS